MKELINLTIQGVFVNDDQSIIVFKTEKHDVAYQAEADCCSESWFADITGFDAMIGSPIQSVEDIELETVDDGRTRQEHDSFYGIKITTQKGVCDIVYRNSSNGYYSGWRTLMEEAPDTSNFKEITEDWSA